MREGVILMSIAVPHHHGSQQETSKRVPCPQCGQSIKVKNLDSHMTKRCKNRDPQARKKLHVKPPARPQPAPTVRDTVSRRPYRPTWGW